MTKTMSVIACVTAMMAAIVNAVKGSAGEVVVFAFIATCNVMIALVEEGRLR